MPVVRGPDGTDAGVEAVIDKDLASALLASELQADVLVLATDVDGVYDALRRAAAAPASGRHARAAAGAASYAAGSMGPKVEAACRFVERGGGRAAIGALDAIAELVGGRGGTQVRGAD